MSVETNQTKIRAATSTVTMMRKVGPSGSWETTQEEDGRSKASRRERGKFDGACYNCVKTGHSSRDCWSTGKGELKGKGGHA